MPRYQFDAAECPNSPHIDEWMHGERCRLCGHQSPKETP